MGSLEIYIKLFLEKLWNILWPLFENKQETKLLLNQAESEEIEKTFTLTSVPDGYSLKRQGNDMCDGEPMESGGPFSVLDEYDDQIPATEFGDPQSLILLDRAKGKCDRTENCKFISVWKDGSYSMYDSGNCLSGKEGINTSVTLENLHQFSGGRVSEEGSIELPPPPPPPPPPLPVANSPESCNEFMENTLKPYSTGETYPGFALSNKTNYCTAMLNRPGIARNCQERICGYTSGPKKGTDLGLIPPWQAIEESGVTYYWNPDTNETKWIKPENIASGDDFFEMNRLCESACLNITGNTLNESQSISKSMLDAIGEVLQIPDKLSSNPWMPNNNIFNQLPEITEDSCLDVNKIERVFGPHDGVGKVHRWGHPVTGDHMDEDWRPRKDSWFNVYGSPEEACSADPDEEGVGRLRQKKILGLNSNKKACKVEFRQTNAKCDRDCAVRFINTEARDAGYHNRYKARSYTSLDDLMEKTGGRTSDIDVDWTDLYSSDTRKEYEIGAKRGVKWGIDERRGTGLFSPSRGAWGLDAPYGYMIMAEYVDIDAPKLGNGKCVFNQSGWYRTAKIPIEDDSDVATLKKTWNFGSRMKVRLVNEDETEQVLIVEDPQNGYFENVLSKTNETGERNWKWDGPISLG